MTDQPETSSLPFVINGQYVKDMSFENPKSPASLYNVKDKPNIELSVDLATQQLQENAYEVCVHVTAKASTAEMPLFLADLSYAGIITLRGEMEKDALQEMLLVDCPAVLFPFARRIIADMTRDGGFPPLMLEPIDFRTLYKNRKSQPAENGADKAKMAVN